MAPTRSHDDGRPPPEHPSGTPRVRPSTVVDEVDEVDLVLDPDVRAELDQVVEDAALLGLRADEDDPSLVGGEVGHLYEPWADLGGPSLDDDEADSIASAADLDDLSAEEAAMHLTADPPLGNSGDGYVEHL